MSIVKGEYELSVWRDVYDKKDKTFVEQKVSIISSDKM
jgi:hypothetical protein